jgi:signal transduction histidine kinase
MVTFSIIAVGGFVFCVALLFLFEAKSLLKRLKQVTQATKSIPKGQFKTIMEGAPKHDEISQLIAGFNQMVRELDEKQEQLVQSRKLASIGTFTSGIAHEINNPLNNISLTADGLLEGFEDLSGTEAREMIHDIITQTSRASSVVKNLLDFSRSDQAVMSRICVSDVISGTLGLVKNQLMVNNIRLTTDIPDTLPAIRGNLHNLEQVFINLFSNAMAAMPDGGDILIAADVQSVFFPVCQNPFDLSVDGRKIPASKTVCPPGRYKAHQRCHILRAHSKMRFRFAFLPASTILMQSSQRDEDAGMVILTC